MMSMKKLSCVALCVALLGGKVMALEDSKPEGSAEQAGEQKPVEAGQAEGEKKPSLEDVLESPKIKELLQQENINWDEVMKALGDMNYNMGDENMAESVHGESSHGGDSNGDSFDFDDEL